MPGSFLQHFTKILLYYLMKSMIQNNDQIVVSENLMIRSVHQYNSIT